MRMMDVGEMIRLHVELGDPDIPIPRLRRLLEQLGVMNAAVAVAAFNVSWSRGRPDYLVRLLAPLMHLVSGATLIFLSAWVSRGPASRRRLARAVARASVLLLMLSVLLGAYGIVEHSN